MTHLDLAYLAGFVDADGNHSVHRSQRSGKWYLGPVVGIAGTRDEPLQLASSFWGGAVRVYGGQRPGTRPCFQWQRQGRSAVPVLTALLPYLRLKRLQALLALDLAEQMEERLGDDPYPWAPAGWDPAPSRWALYEEVLELNQPRNRRPVRAIDA